MLMTNGIRTYQNGIDLKSYTLKAQESYIRAELGVDAPLCAISQWVTFASANFKFRGTQRSILRS